MGPLSYALGLSEGGAGTIADAILPDSVRETAERIGAAAVETVERDAWMEIIDEMPIVGDWWTITPAMDKGPNGFPQPATWELTDKGRTAALVGALGVAVVLAVVLAGRR